MSKKAPYQEKPRNGSPIHRRNFDYSNREILCYGDMTVVLRNKIRH